VGAAGLYVPGGLGVLSVLGPDERDPGAVAGVERLVICVPTPDGWPTRWCCWPAQIAGVDEIYRIGGAQAIAALAYGTETDPPGRQDHRARQRLCGGGQAAGVRAVGIDMIAGPSEILVIADADNDPDWIALDLLSQAEHDESAQSILITDRRRLRQAVAGAVDAAARRWSAAPSPGQAGATFGAVDRARPGEAAALSTASRPNIWSCAWPTPRRWRRSPMPARSSWASGRPRRSATMSAGRTTCCPPRGRRGSPRGCRCWISSSARR
jgi:histidinol dehydrogenase